MSKAKSAAKAPKEFKPTEALRQGWLAYLGVYGLAYERAKPAVANFGEKYAEFFSDLVNKGEELETVAKDQLVDVSERAKGIYGAGFEKARNVLPISKTSGSRVKELEAEVEALNKKVASLTKRPTTRTKRAKAA